MNKNTKNKSLLKVIRKVSSVIMTLILVACVILAAYAAISSSNGNGFSIGPYQLVTVLSGSMEPSLSTGSLAVVKEASKNELSVGDIITFRAIEGRTTLVTHRITRTNSDGSSFTTMGDNNNVEDSSPVPYESVIGKVVFSIPLIGYLINSLKTPLGIVILLAIIILYEIIRYYLMKTKRGENTYENNS